MAISSIGLIDIVPSITKHADYLHTRLRKTDMREIWLHEADPSEALHCPLQYNHKTMTALINGKPLCMFGTVGIDDTNDAIVWALGSDLINKHKKSFYKASLKVVHMLQGDYKTIWNIVPYDHLETISWLQKLGFTVAEEYISLKNIPMLYFSRCNKEKSMTTVH
jgi:hypothetical protein